MAIRDKRTLKAFFKKGARPTEGNFSDLIDSMYNKLDDDILSSEEDETASNTSHFAKIVNEKINGLSFIDIITNTPVINFKPGGYVGIGIVAPLYKLHVEGTIAAEARVGTYKDATVDPDKIFANGKWQKIITGLDGLHAFEILASAKGAKGKGDYALLHATALSAYGNSKSSISQHSARYKGFCPNIELKWTGKLNSYNLEIRTKYDFGNGVKINYNITHLISG